MKTAAIIPVKTFLKAKTRLELSTEQTEKICEIMLEEILQVLSVSPQIDEIIIVTKDKKALDVSKKFKVTQIIDNEESGVNDAVSLADEYLLKNGFETSIVFPQDIPYIKTQDIARRYCQYRYMWGLQSIPLKRRANLLGWPARAGYRRIHR